MHFRHCQNRGRAKVKGSDKARSNVIKYIGIASLKSATGKSAWTSEQRSLIRRILAGEARGIIILCARTVLDRKHRSLV